MIVDMRSCVLVFCPKGSDLLSPDHKTVTAFCRITANSAQTVKWFAFSVASCSVIQALFMKYCSVMCLSHYDPFKVGAGLTLTSLLDCSVCKEKPVRAISRQYNGFHMY